MPPSPLVEATGSQVAAKFEHGLMSLPDRDVLHDAVDRFQGL